MAVASVAKPSVEQLMAEVETLRARLAEKSNLVCKVSPKRALSVYGLQRMPVTLYAEQWERLIGFAPHITSFIAENNGKLSRKGA